MVRGVHACVEARGDQRRGIALLDERRAVERHAGGEPVPRVGGRIDEACPPEIHGAAPEAGIRQPARPGDRRVRGAARERTHGGEPQIQDYLSLFLDAVNQGKLSLDRLVRITSYNPAKVFNIFPKKGVLLPGSDADMVIVDMNKEEVISNDTTYTKVGWTPYHGRKVKGMPIRTILRGKTVMQDGKIVGQPGDGELVKPLA